MAAVRVADSGARGTAVREYEYRQYRARARGADGVPDAMTGYKRRSVYTGIEEESNTNRRAGANTCSTRVALNAFFSNSSATMNSILSILCSVLYPCTLEVTAGSNLFSNRVEMNSEFWKDAYSAQVATRKKVTTPSCETVAG